MAKRIAVVLFNLGGPDNQDAVQPFLQNLFSDPAIIRAPAPIRWLISRVVSRRRAPSVKENYALMDAGGGSPLLPETLKQADALSAELERRWPEDTVRVFTAMRYWHPFVEDAAKDVEAWGPDEVILLPLYPQYSTTTTGSSLSAWAQTYRGKTKTVCCYPFADALISAHVDKIMDAYEKAGKPPSPTLLMSAHGLPESIIKDGDPYQWQCESLGGKLAQRLPSDWEIIGCYQSRVGPLKWIGPSTEEEVEKAALAGKDILIAPIAFVSEHIETLVELGEEYRETAEKAGARSYTRVDALGTHDGFINMLADFVEHASAAEDTLRSCEGGRLCPAEWTDCPHGKKSREPVKKGS